MWYNPIMFICFKIAGTPIAVVTILGNLRTEDLQNSEATKCKH